MTIRMWAILGDAFRQPSSMSFDYTKNMGTFTQLPHSMDLPPGTWAIWNSGMATVIVMVVEVQVA